MGTGRPAPDLPVPADRLPPVPHALLIAVVFTAYMGSMAGLLAYIAATGRPRAREEDPDGSQDGGRGDAQMRRAA